MAVTYLYPNSSIANLQTDSLHIVAKNVIKLY